ncbi:DEKNAAC103347 [Brettanomyces naardenensis]|uniref:RNA helicase n=1 Tax=Brettanomyces naardenensis TaxID=13370 RepID=A0A448YN77_BRENA|nr:DEKNAAC103347 [Brettanomyces naardenensis]
MSGITKGELKRRRRNGNREEWKEEDVGEDLERDVEGGKLSSRISQAPKKTKETVSISDQEEQILFGNGGKDLNRTDDTDFNYLRKLARQRYLTERERRQMILLEGELRDFEGDIKEVGWEKLAERERREYTIKKEIMDIYRRRKEIEEAEKNGGSGSFLIQDDYVTTEGRIDTKRKHDVLWGKANRGRYGDSNDDDKMKGVSRYTHLKEAKPEKKYEYVFDRSQEVEFTSDGDDDEPELTSEQRELEEKIKAEEARVRSIEETRKSLPVYKYRDELIAAVKKYPILIVVGETGSGKTTQLPQYLYEAGFSGKQKLKIGCTQPRRVAATAVASRVADEVGTRLGDRVGYSVRFDDKTTDNTVIKYMTDGMLLREFMSDPELLSYSVMMVDEAHERSLHTDILLGLLKEVSAERPDFRILISSATMNAEKFSTYFDEAPIFNIPGRRFPVTIHYTLQPEANYLHAATTTVFQIHLSQKGPGGILVFLTGQDEIETMAENLRSTCERLSGQMDREMIVCPIYANLPSEKQQLIFAPTGKNSRKVVLATNIAETSLTIDGISFVIDSGFVKEDRFSPTTGMQSLSVVPCSRAAADQRAGRAGRTGPGKCFRLYTKWAFLHEMPESPAPEILRANLAGVVLQMLSLGITDLIHFDFLDPPSPESLIKALEQLYALGALNEKGELTRVGRKMTDLPCDPMLAKCLVTAGDLGCCRDVVSIVAMLEESGSIEGGRSKKKAADNGPSNGGSSDPSASSGNISAMEKFRSRAKARLGGDHLTLLEIWNQFVDSGFSPQWCRDNNLQYRALNRARSVRNQLEKLCERLALESEEKGLDELDEDDKDRMRVRIMKAIASGFFANAAKLGRSGDSYRTLKKNQTVWIHPSSALFKMKPPPKMVIYNELVLTSKEFMRNCMPISAKWLEEYAPHYYKSTEPERGS